MLKTDGPLTVDRLKEVARYDPETGAFTRIKKTGTKTRVGQRMDLVNPRWLYRTVEIDGRKYRAHRLAWLYMTGDWPSEEIDHINRAPGDNRFCNLREANRSQNTANGGPRRNNKSGYRGVTWHKPLKCWRAQIETGGKGYHLGYFDDPEDAHEAYLSAAKFLFGEFAPAKAAA